MCIIVDANQASDFANRRRQYFDPLYDWIRRGGVIITGGHLERELLKVESFRALALEWSRKGTLRRLPADEVDQVTTKIGSKCKSNDPHVVALAILSNADAVVTCDKNLIEDLKDGKLVGHRRAIYKENDRSPGRIDRHKKFLNRLDCP